MIKARWSECDSKAAEDLYRDLNRTYHKLLSDANIPFLHGTWGANAAFVDVSPTAILGEGSRVDVKYRTDTPSPCVTVGECSQVFGRLVLQREGARISIGKRSQIGSGDLIAAHEISIGDDVLMAWGYTIMDSNTHSLDWTERRNDVLMCGINYYLDPNNLARDRDWSDAHGAPVRIGNRVWIGFNVSILKGVTIGDEAVVAAGSVITKDVPPHSIVAGNPAKVVRVRNAETFK